LVCKTGVAVFKNLGEKRNGGQLYVLRRKDLDSVSRREEKGK